jgi:hypothetical protein
MSTLTVGTISEKVTDAGVAVDGVTLKDGGATFTSSISGTSVSASGTLAVTGNTTVGGTLVNTGLITASAGVAIGGTGSANTLDDYEEGSFTVQFLNDGSTSYNKQLGRYTKIGRMVVASFHLDITSNSIGSNQLKISLPFTTANVTSTFGNGGGYHCNAWSTTNKPDNGLANPNTAEFRLFNSGGQVNAVNVTGNDIGTGNCLGHCIFEVAS